jgi:hypothetical protein
MYTPIAVIEHVPMRWSGGYLMTPPPAASLDRGEGGRGIAAHRAADDQPGARTTQQLGARVGDGVDLSGSVALSLQK